MKLNMTPKAKGAAVLTFLILGTIAVILAPKIGCACGGPLVDEPTFDLQAAHALIGQELVTKRDDRMAVYEPYASVKIKAGTPARVLSIAPIAGGSSAAEQEYELVVGFQVRSDCTDVKHYRLSQFIETFTDTNGEAAAQ